MPYADSNYERNWQRQAKGWVLHPVRPLGQTPGPWHLEWDADRESFMVYDAPPDENGEVFLTIAEVHVGERVSNQCHQPANARLIAAAPDLLEACEELLIYLGDWDDTENETCVAARRAIAKARGQEVPNG